MPNDTGKTGKSAAIVTNHQNPGDLDRKEAFGVSESAIYAVRTVVSIAGADDLD